MNWLNEFKAALVSENLDRIEYLINNYPPKLSPEELECTAELLKSATQLFRNRQKELEVELKKVKKAKKYDF
ncbi:hypothetical protein [Campylobacter porcelli]|uniref:Uncharacterized protein n=1 Tax=Campylobacter porcelli TaxID=1660073 RepID=A0A1X9SXD3_9BACT|nr:hypothetical protein [Campylobacter sp. RM6137]ARR00856.1 hypothetical protein CSUIS_1044 [Campylobacter sp. RM6137]MEE3745150.1 hypothetical protein [Campylobacter sp. CX2-4855-23]